MKPSMKAASTAFFISTTFFGGTACGIAVSGDFDGIEFSPNASALVVADVHDLLLRGSSVVPVTMPTAAQKIHVMLSGAAMDVEKDFRSMPSNQLTNLKKNLVLADGLLLQDIPLDEFSDGEELRVQISDGRSTGDFFAAISQATSHDRSEPPMSLGALVTVTLEPQSLQVDGRGGSISLAARVKRERAADQDGDVATGEVEISLSLPLQPERLAESNLSVVAPVLRCMQETGFGNQESCRREDADSVVDETGFVE